MPVKKRYRPDRDGGAKSEFVKNRKRIIASGEVCALCGMPIDKSLRFPDPMSASVDHIIPIARGGHPSDPSNLQLTHLICNQQKASRVALEVNKGIDQESVTISNRILPQSTNWRKYGA